MKTTQYFQYTRQRPDRIIILDEWIQNTINEPLREEIQADGRIRRWARILIWKTECSRYFTGRR